VSTTRPDAVAAWEALFRAQVVVLRVLAAEHIWDELSLHEYDVLFNLSRAPQRRLPLHALNRQVLLTQSSVSRLVDRLGARDLVRREPDPNDRRSTVVALTDQGAALQRTVGARHAASIRRRLGAALTPAELAQLTRLAETLRHAVESQP